MEAPKGIQILAEAGDIQAICRNELRLESKDGEVGPQFACFPLYCTGYTGRITPELPNWLFWKQRREEAIPRCFVFSTK